MPVAPPTEPAVCTRNIGLPVAPRASVRYSSGFMIALEQVGGLAEDDGVDVGPVHLGVLERAAGRLPDQPAERDVPAAALVVGLADADDRARLMSHQSFPSRMQTRFCCRHGPDDEWAERASAVGLDDRAGPPR